jgi:hypothetical protein
VELYRRLAEIDWLLRDPVGLDDVDDDYLRLMLDRERGGESEGLLRILRKISRDEDGAEGFHGALLAIVTEAIRPIALIRPISPIGQSSIRAQKKTPAVRKNAWWGRLSRYLIARRERLDIS